jgi:hypothetical protein
MAAEASQAKGKSLSLKKGGKASISRLYRLELPGLPIAYWIKVANEFVHVIRHHIPEFLWVRNNVIHGGRMGELSESMVCDSDHVSICHRYYHATDSQTRCK